MAEQIVQVTAPPEAGETRDDEPGAVAAPEELDELLVEDLLVEDVSIDGMCGVY